jgi:murein L,D-transpeptidase YafK
MRSLVVLALFSVLACRGEHSVAAPLKADRIVVDKSERTLNLFFDNRPLKTYKIALGRNPVGAKERQGDGKTPEGSYVIDYRNRNSLYYRSLHISYPTIAQRRDSRTRGIDPGGDIMIHGLPNGQGKLGKAHRLYDWTEGCIAVTNEEIDEIWAAVKDGTKIEIRP